MTFRLSQKLAMKLKVDDRPELAFSENPYADWSAHVFSVGRIQYILLAYTKSLYDDASLAQRFEELKRKATEASRTDR